MYVLCTTFCGYFYLSFTLICVLLHSSRHCPYFLHLNCARMRSRRERERIYYQQIDFLVFVVFCTVKLV
ncbi:hypothetical protein C0J52_25986 [Blattella germanica]|nr:hypothetical protein C0J52_25986 [Blattella germanica]